MPLDNKQAPNYYSTRFTGGNSSTAIDADAFGFNARLLRFINTEAVDFYVRLGSTQYATTADLRIRSCSELTLPLPAPVYGVATFSTSTAASALKLGLVAVGGDAY